ncbi:hypothetical protein QZH41_011866, partial [Actinostola sp. cb2023]
VLDHMEATKTSLIDEAQDFSSPWHFSDAVLVVEDTKFYVHKSILSMWSPVFEKMFTSPFAERTATKIPLPEKRKDEIEVLLRLIYSNGTKQKVSDTNYFYLLELAEEYQMDDVKKYCIDFLTSAIEASNCLYLCHVADRFCLKDVMTKCIEEARYKGSNALQGNEDFEDLTPELKNEVCMERIKELEKSLQEYTSACSRLVERVYHTTAERLQKSCDKLDDHRQLVTVSAGFVSQTVQPFDLACECCTQRVEEADWNRVGTNFYVLKDYLTKLHALQRSSRVAASVN